jgi:hypothetical protein
MRGCNHLKLSLFFLIKVTNRKLFTCSYFMGGEL